MKSIEVCRLYAFVDTAYLCGRAPDDIARALCDGGADIIQLRAKDSGPEEIRRLAESILPITRAAGVPLVINDYPTIAHELGAACHLGQEDFFDAGYSHVRDLPGFVDGDETRPLIGLSTHSASQAMRAVRAEPAYVAIGPVFATGTKPLAKPVTLEYVRWAAAEVKIPWFAIGGINFATLDSVLEAGARRICVVSAILNAPDVTMACREYKSILETVGG